MRTAPSHLWATGPDQAGSRSQNQWLINQGPTHARKRSHSRRHPAGHRPSDTTHTRPLGCRITSRAAITTATSPPPLPMQIPGVKTTLGARSASPQRSVPSMTRDPRLPPRGLFPAASSSSHSRLKPGLILPIKAPLLLLLRVAVATLIPRTAGDTKSANLLLFFALFSAFLYLFKCPAWPAQLRWRHFGC